MQGFFYGWYFKCQSSSKTLVLIPAVHQTGRERFCSIQVMIGHAVWWVDYPADVFWQKGKQLSIGKNEFGEKGIYLDIQTPELTAKGELRFGPLHPLKYDIMGPFALVPGMECRHSVWSMRHTVSGSLRINGENYSFRNACGYWEGDRGHSFPKEYLWTQCCFPEGSLMLSVADIPLGKVHFTGILGMVLWKGRQYRIATYLGARVKKLQNGVVRVVQGNMELEARFLEKSGHPLKAPAGGAMSRVIHENASCRAFYRFSKKGKLLFAFETEQASFEYEFKTSIPHTSNVRSIQRRD